MINDTTIDKFFGYARERYKIFLKREKGEPAPWTDNEILQGYRFCNVFREDDKVTRWFKENVREPLEESDEVIFATVAFRFFNTIKTGEQLVNCGLLTHWNGEEARYALSGLKPLITGAYMVKTPIGVSPKLDGLIQILNPIYEDREILAKDLRKIKTLREAHERLMVYPWVGPFMAYEFVTDLAHTKVLIDATDKMTWANPGPGAMRGISRLLHYNPNTNVSYGQMQTTMQDILKLSQDNKYWPKEWPAWTMREVEHTFCEFDKYMRAKTGKGRPKQKYKGV